MQTPNLQAVSHPTILYVDDVDETRSVLQKSLKRHGYRVLVDVSEEDAIERGRERRIDADLLLIDLGKPPSVVVEVARRIRQQAMREQVPVVVIAFGYSEEMEGKDIDEGEKTYVSYFDGSGHFEQLLARLLQ